MKVLKCSLSARQGKAPTRALVPVKAKPGKLDKPPLARTSLGGDNRMNVKLKGATPKQPKQPKQAVVIPKPKTLILNLQNRKPSP